MLQRLSIRNFALIDAVDLELGSGLLVVTGETGAGKSIVFDAISLLLGGRASTEVIRRDADEASVLGVFGLGASASALVLARLEEAGVPVDDGQLIVRRVVSRSGRNRSYMNDVVVTAGLLSEVVGSLVDILGQHQHLALTRPDEQRGLLDRRAAHGALLESMDVAWRVLREVAARRRELESARAGRLERLEFLRFQRDELRGLSLRAGEFVELESSLGRVRNAERLRQAVGEAVSLLLESDGAAVERLAEATAQVTRAQSWDPSLEPLRVRLEELEALTADVAQELRGALVDVPDDLDLDALEGRHELLRSTFRRYGVDESGLLDRLAEIEEEIDRLEHYAERLEGLDEEEQRARAAAEEAADRLDASRRQAGDELFAAAAVRLAGLGMPGAQLALAPAGGRGRALSRHGWEDIELLFSANTGEEPRPLGKVASGGELSRLMLALKTCVIERDPVPTYLFDEVDTGIGGQAAVAVAGMLRELGERRQVFCITHLPQIASRAHEQYFVSKQVESGRTTSVIRRLSADERALEVARMLGGEQAGAATLAHARELLGGAVTDGAVTDGTAAGGGAAAGA